MIIRLSKSVLFNFFFAIPALVFITSGYTKLMSVELLEIMLVESGVIGWSFAPIASRLIIGTEFLLGAGLFVPAFSKKSARSALLFLLFLSVYLIYLWQTEGAEKDCGCFGAAYKMNSIEALIKNFLLIALLTLGLVLKDSKKHQQPSNGISWLVAILLLASPFSIVPIEFSELSTTAASEPNERLLDSVVTTAFYKRYPLSFQPKAGKKIIAFLSLTCEHCRLGARKLQTMLEKHPHLPVYFVLNGDSKNLKPFYQETKTHLVPYAFLFGKNFIRTAGLSLPVILLVNGSVIEYRLRYTELNEKAIQDWLSIPAVK